MDDQFRRACQRIEEISDRKEAELLMLCQDPDTYRVAQALTDALLVSLKYLCNFKFIVDGNGLRVSIDELQQELQKQILDEFKALTGKEYVFPICRQFYTGDQS